MPHVLAGLQSTEITLMSGKPDSEGREVGVYTNSNGQPYQALVLGELVHTEELDDATRIIVLGPSPESAPITREMFFDQHKLLNDLLLSRVGDDRKARRSALLVPPGLIRLRPMIFVRVSDQTCYGIRDFSNDESGHPFASSATDIPYAVPGEALDPLEKGALVFCAVDMFAADLPITQGTASPHSVYTTVGELPHDLTSTDEVMCCRLTRSTPPM
ncbi:hypothetical protein C8F04DRAFT_1260987 [Mycena alexandri]|uniref:Uncharacterized protein n=1 Tax=Mycena alexandri TaxID=1745969 RepID=A0AAD6SXA8_9AGAR|nr:hypothetical protein C8F04DRAFT_1260987 [Mycena alexandri]